MYNGCFGCSNWDKLNNYLKFLLFWLNYCVIFVGNKMILEVKIVGIIFVIFIFNGKWDDFVGVIILFCWWFV